MTIEQRQYDAEITNHLRDLSDSDWFITRYAETGIPIPENIMLFRADARNRISLLRLALRPENSEKPLEILADAEKTL